MGIQKKIDAAFYSEPTCLTRFENWRYKLCQRSKSVDMVFHNQWIFVFIWRETMRLISSATVHVLQAKWSASATLMNTYPALMQLAMVAHEILLDFKAERRYHDNEDDWNLRLNELGDKIINAPSAEVRYSLQLELLSVLKCEPCEPLSSIPDMTRFWDCLVEVCKNSSFSCSKSGPLKPYVRANCLGSYHVQEAYLAKQSLCEGLRIERYNKQFSRNPSFGLLYSVEYTEVNCVECRVLHGLLYTNEEYIAEKPIVEDYPSNNVSGNRKYGRQVLDIFETLFLASTRIDHSSNVLPASEGKCSSFLFPFCTFVL